MNRDWTAKDGTAKVGRLLFPLKLGNSPTATGKFPVSVYSFAKLQLLPCAMAQTFARLTPKAFIISHCLAPEDKSFFISQTLLYVSFAL